MSVSLVGADGETLVRVSYDGFMADCEPANEGAYLMVGDVCCTATEGAQDLVSFGEGCVQAAYEELYPESGVAPEVSASSTWVNEDDWERYLASKTAEV